MTVHSSSNVTRPAVILLVAAPLLMALARVLLVPFDDQKWDQVLNQMAAHQGRSDTGWILALAASGLLAATALMLARRLSLTGKTEDVARRLDTRGWGSSQF